MDKVSEMNLKIRLHFRSELKIEDLRYGCSLEFFVEMVPKKWRR